MKSTKNAFLIIISIIIITQLSCSDNTTEPEKGEWSSLGLEGKLVNELKLIDSYLYACAGKDGLYRFDLIQSNYEWEYLGLADTSIERTLMSGVTDIILTGGNLIVSYIAGYQLKYSGIYRSVDNGITWYPSDSGMTTNSSYPTSSQVIRLQQHPSNDDIIVAGTTVSLLYKSENSGLWWKKVTGTEGASAFNFAVRFHPIFTQQIWAGGETGRFAPYLLNSTDGGESWSDYIEFPKNFGPYTYDNAVYDIAIDPTDDNILYFGMLGVIGKTTDKGETFERTLGWEDGIYRHWRLSINPDNPLELFTTGAYLYKTNDGGKSWQKINSPQNEIYALVVNWQDKVLYASVSDPENGIYKYTFR